MGYRADALVGVETIRAVIEAYAKGEIELEPPPTNHKGSHMTQAYSLPGGKLYVLTVSSFQRLQDASSARR